MDLVLRGSLRGFRALTLSVTLLVVITISTFWQAPCDDSVGAAVPFEVSLVRVFPKRGKCVGCAGSCVNASVSRRFISIGLWSRGYRQDMPPGGQIRIVTLIKPQIRNVYTVDEQVEELECSKIGFPGHNQTSVIVGMG
jgi:hypothetical protein